MDGRSSSFRSELILLLPRLRRFGHALTGSADAADDLVQDALERAMRRQAQYEPGTRLDSWMYRMMQTIWIDERRKQTVRRQHAPGVDPGVVVGRAEAAHGQRGLAQVQPVGLGIAGAQCAAMTPQARRAPELPVGWVR